MKKYLKYKGKRLKVMISQLKNKKYKVKYNGKEIHFGEKGYKIAVGTARGDRYCKRSQGIKSKNKGLTANKLSRKMWNCVGGKSKK